MRNLMGSALLFALAIWGAADSAQAASTKLKLHYCQAGRFAPCVCVQDVSKDVSYRPSYPTCGGNAAILTRGKYLNIFSVVVRDDNNRDRWPASGFHGCSAKLASSANPPAKCSAFKVQKTFVEGKGKTLQRVNCLGAPGTSKLFSRVVRMTGKISDAPGTTNDPLARWCLKSPKLPLH